MSPRSLVVDGLVQSGSDASERITQDAHMQRWYRITLTDLFGGRVSSRQQDSTPFVAASFSLDSSSARRVPCATELHQIDGAT